MRGVYAFGLLILLVLCGCTDSMDLPAITRTAPQATITTDGNTADWTGIIPMLTDMPGDGGAYSGLDLTSVYLAYDVQNLYLRFDRVGDVLPLNEYSNFWIYLKPAAHGAKGYAVECFHSSPTQREVRLWNISNDPGNYNTYIRLSSNLSHSFGSQTVEITVPRSLLILQPAFDLSFYTHHTNNYVWQKSSDTSDTVRLTFVP